MRITLRAYGNLRNYMPQHRERLSLEIDSDTTVEALLARVGIPIQEVGLVAIDGGMVAESRTLTDGDDLELFSPIGGGSTAGVLTLSSVSGGEGIDALRIQR